MEDKIFSVTDQHFEDLAIEIFHFQYEFNIVYRNWVNTLGIDPASVNNVQQIPFLPIGFFKTHQVIATQFQPEAIFESSGTTGSTPSSHFLKSMKLYQKSFTLGFERFYGNPDQYVILGLLPSYLERKNSSLIVMVDALMKETGNESSGFYLHNHDELTDVLQQLAHNGQRVILIGVTFALLDFALPRKLDLPDTIVMETGGMKGRRDEITRQEVHGILKDHLGVREVHSEYGMTELLSQAYALSAGVFQTPPWMKILLRDEEDPLSLKEFHSIYPGRGVINVIDLANLYSCSFIATEDLGTLYADGFTVEGRLDRSDMRGCSLLTI